MQNLKSALFFVEIMILPIEPISNYQLFDIKLPVKPIHRFRFTCYLIIEVPNY